MIFPATTEKRAFPALSRKSHHRQDVDRQHANPNIPHPKDQRKTSADVRVSPHPSPPTWVAFLFKLG
jgi:hypothetical protein